MDDEIIRRSENTRSNILQSACELFIRQGYHGTSMRQIAQNSGIALGGLYNHFSGKEEVFEEVLLVYHPYHDIFPGLLAADGETIEEFVRNAIHSMVAAMHSRPDFLNLMFIEIVEFKSAHVEALFSHIFPLALQVIQRLNMLDTGELRRLPPMVFVRLFAALFLGYYLSEVAFSPHLPPEFSQGAEAHFVDVFLHGILKPNRAE